jgi:alpha-ketoglutarate-dependent taurine dioxygenase
MAIIFQHDKRSDKTYAYESHSYWDKEKKTSRAKRTLIGRVDPVTGKIIPTDGRRKKDKIETPKEPDYKTLYEKLQKKCVAQETLIAALQKELNERKGEPKQS